jgi:formylglycine-generating enzyme required for sulfatase activity
VTWRNARAVLAAVALWPAVSLAESPLEEQNRLLFRQLQEVHGLSDQQMTEIRTIFARSGVLGQGNPAIVEHPMTPGQCRAKLEQQSVRYDDPEFARICQAKYMAPLYDPGSEGRRDAKACIDQFEFPDIPCTYPVVWVRAREAAELCAAMGKRLCDAHEWEGACTGRLEPPDYPFDLAVGVRPNTAVERMRKAHNQAHEADRTWSYGPAYRTGVCAAASHKSATCDGGGWPLCGSNTYPTGAFPDCHSPLDVYDLNGNAAEHMNLPLARDQMASRGSKEVGYTEMKGSWFIFDHYRAHEDWCRWRAPFWHGSRVMDPKSHENYHLGFRCCKTLGGAD